MPVSRTLAGAVRQWLIEKGVPGPGFRRGLLVIVDQFEELLTQTAPLVGSGSPSCAPRREKLAGIDVDDRLVDQLVDDTDSGDALPLLAFTLAQLADGISRGGSCRPNGMSSSAGCRGH